MANRPNILFFHLDNVSQGDFGCYGGGFPIGAETPNIDRFATESKLLTNYNVEAQCTPTRSALMTGRHSVRTGCVSVAGGAGLVAWETTIADRLKDLGYNNAILGKWHIGDEPGRYPTDFGFDYWYGISGTWDEALWPQDKWFLESGLEPRHVQESTKPREIELLEVLDTDVRRNIDLTFLEKGKQWMQDSVDKDEPFFLYFNHSNVHAPTLPRDEYVGSSGGGAVADCIQMVDGDFQQLLDKIDELGIKDNTIVVFAGDNGRDTSFHAPGNRGAPGNFRGGYFSTGEGNNRTVCIARWPGKIEPGRSDGMMHVTDWFPTLMHLVDNEDGIPNDRVIDGIDQSGFITGSQEDSNREYFHMFFDEVHVGLRWKNFKVLTHVVDTGYAPLLKLASPHIYNLTVNPDEDTPYNYELMHSWVLYDIYIPLARQLAMSLAEDSIPNGSPVDYNPNDG
ncbi:MAG: arylsulfatase [Acidimicrobiia bacterium]|nr:MAG: arylsulfatase [Acidimicrobiia bacterium]